MRTMTERLPPYQFLTAFSQLISRICHPNSDVFAQLEVITSLVYHALVDSEFLLDFLFTVEQFKCQSMFKRGMDCTVYVTVLCHVYTL